MRLLHLAAHESHRALEVDLACEEQSSEEDYGRWIHRPHHLALVYGRHMVDLHADVARGTWSVEHVHLHILCICESLHRFLLCSDAEIRLRHLRQCCESGLPFLLLSFEFEVEFGSQGLVSQSRHEDSLGIGVGSGNHVVGQLVDVAEEARLKQCGLHLVATQFLYVLYPEISEYLRSVGVHLHGEHLSSLTSLHGSHRTAHGRCKFHLRIIFVDKQCITGLDLVAFLHDYLRHHAAEAVGLQGILAVGLQLNLFPLSPSGKVNVKTFAQLK